MKSNTSNNALNSKLSRFVLPRGWYQRTGGWAALMAVILAASLMGCSAKKQTASSAKSGRGAGGFGPTVVGTTKATEGSIGIYVTGLGLVTPLETVSINSRVQGQIVAVKYHEGQEVKAGDPLIEIDPGPSQAAVTQAEGQLKRDTAILKDARLDLERYTEAYASNAIPKQQLNTQVAMVEQDEGTVELDHGNLDNARVQLGYCHIAAPVSGRVGLRLVDEGNMVQSSGSTALVVITKVQPITVVFPVAEDALPDILAQWRAGKTMVVDAFDRSQTNKLATGQLEALDNQVDTSSGTVKLRAIFTNEDESLFPNQFVNARLLVRTLEHATLLPNAVVQRNTDGAFVYLFKPDQPAVPAAGAAVDPPAGGSDAGGSAGGARTNGLTGTVAMQPVTITTTDGNVYAVEGIEPGTVVVANNFNKLADGAQVTVRPAGAGADRGNGIGTGQGRRHGAGDGQTGGTNGSGSGHWHKDQTNSAQ